MPSPTQKVTFTPPMGAVPEGTGQGQDFDLVCTFRLEAGGKVCLTVMGEHRMPGYDKGKPEERPSYRQEAQAIQSTAPTPGPDMQGGAGGGY